MNNPNATTSSKSKTDILNIKIDSFLIGLNVLSKAKKSVYRLATLPITEEDRSEIKAAIKARNDINEARGVTKFKQYYRDPKLMVDEKGLTPEVMFTKVINKIANNGLVPGYEVETPPIAVEVLDNSRQDYVIKGPEQSLNFDIKGQTIDSRSFNINEKALNRMLDQDCKFIIAALMSFPNNDFNQADKIELYYLDIDYFVKNSRYVDPPGKTPFRSMPLELIKPRTH